MKAVLIDDEFYALQGLKIELEGIKSLEIAGMFEDGLEALSQIEQLKPDIVFLDIEMPGIDGIKLFQKIVDIKEDINIIFVTAYNEYAVKAFELNALDYIVKPVQKDRLIKAVSRIPQTSKQKAKKDYVQIQCFKQLTITVNNEIVNIGRRNKKAEELIAYLACEKGRYVSKEKIAEELWPELNVEKGLSNL